MIVVPAGSFFMGSPESEEGHDDEEGPQHRVTILEPFAVGKHEVAFGVSPGPDRIDKKQWLRYPPEARFLSLRRTDR